MQTIKTWLADVNAKNGNLGVLIVVVTLVAMILAIVLLTGVSLSDVTHA